MSDPESRNEALLGDMLGETNAYGEPQSAVEALLQNILGEDNVIREPQSRVETLLKDILDNGAIGMGMTVNTRKFTKSTSQVVTWAFTKPGTFYISASAPYSTSSSTSVSMASLSYEAGAAITATEMRKTNQLYCYKLVVTASETANDMKFKLSTSSTTSSSLYYTTYTWYADKYDSTPYSIS